MQCKSPEKNFFKSVFQNNNFFPRCMLLYEIYKLLTINFKIPLC